MEDAKYVVGRIDSLSNPPMIGLIARQSDFIESFIRQQKEIHNTAREKGWWGKGRNDGELIALIHSELSEALEALRHGNPPDDKVPQFNGLEAELADAIIRIMDFAEARNLRLAEAVVAKAEYNKTRPIKHGKEF